MDCVDFLRKQFLRVLLRKENTLSRLWSFFLLIFRIVFDISKNSIYFVMFYSSNIISRRTKVTWMLKMTEVKIWMTKVIIKTYHSILTGRWILEQGVISVDDKRLRDLLQGWGIKVVEKKFYFQQLSVSKLLCVCPGKRKAFFCLIRSPCYKYSHLLTEFTFLLDWA